MTIKTLQHDKILIKDIDSSVTLLNDDEQECVEIYTNKEGFRLKYKGLTYIISKGGIVLEPEYIKYDNKLERPPTQINLFD